MMNTVASTWCENMLGYLFRFVLGHYLFLKAHSFFPELRSRKTVRFSEQIMSADKHLSIFSRQLRLFFIYIFIYYL